MKVAAMGSPDEPSPVASQGEAFSEMEAEAPTGVALEIETSSRRLEFDFSRWLELLVILATGLLMVLSLAVLIRLLLSIPHTLLLFSLGALLAYAFDPIVEWVRGQPNKAGKRRPRWVGVVFVFAVFFMVLSTGGLVLGETLADQTGILIRDRGEFQTNGQALVLQADAWFDAHGFSVSLNEYLRHPPPELKAWAQEFTSSALNFARRFVTSTFESLIVLLIAVYLLIYAPEMRRNFNRGLPDRIQPYVEQWLNDTNHILGSFVRGQVVIAVVMGIAAALGCAALGIQLWLLIGIFVVFASLIPVFGPYLGAIPAFLAALLTPASYVSPVARAILVLILFVLINEGGSKILYPRLVGAALGLHEVLVLFVLFAGLEIGKIVGVLFAAPLTALAMVTAMQIYRLWMGLPPYSMAKAASRARQVEKVQPAQAAS